MTLILVSVPVGMYPASSSEDASPIKAPGEHLPSLTFPALRAIAQPHGEKCDRREKRPGVLGQGPGKGVSGLQ